MNYEAKTFVPINVTNSQEAAILLKGDQKNLKSYNAIAWPIPAGTAYAVPDMDIHSSNPWFETAIIFQPNGGSRNERYQVESLTIGWMEELAEVKTYLDKSFQNVVPELALGYYGKAQLVLTVDGKKDPNRTAFFTCSCCGAGFKGIVEVQEKHDQDTGYGYCPRCTDRYHS